MKNRISFVCGAASVVALPFLLVGCDREVSRTSTSSAESDGSSRSKEKVVSQSGDGTVTKEEIKETIDSDGTVESQEKTTVESPDGTVIKEESTESTIPNTP